MAETEPFEIIDYIYTNKIKRLALKESALVEILRIESPASLFVRQKSHVRDQLVHKEPYELRALDAFSPGSFALGPVAEREFGRCVILNHFESQKACRVFFIDDAIVVDVSESCLFEIDELDVHYPWQVMHITLGRLTSLEGVWTAEQCEEFEKVLSNFDTFEITPCQIDVDTEPDRPSILVNLYGLPDGCIEKKQCIEEMCGSLIKNTMVSMFPMNLTEDPKLGGDIGSSVLIDEFRKALPEDWVHEPDLNFELEDENWAIENCQVSVWNWESLEKYQDENGRFLGIIEPKVVESPSEMSIIPVLHENLENMDNEDWIFEGFDDMRGFKEVLNDFYSVLKNQRPLQISEIEEEFEKGNRIYAIAHIDRRLETGFSWNRCEVTAKLSDNCVAIRFIDHGMKRIEKMKNLYRIHKLHTYQRPLTLEIGKTLPVFVETDIDGNETTKRLQWPEAHRVVWKEMVQFETIVVVGPESFDAGRLEINELYVLGDDAENLLKQIPMPTKEETHDN